MLGRLGARLGDRRARLRAVAQAERLRLGATARLRRRAGGRRRRRRDGGSAGCSTRSWSGRPPRNETEAADRAPGAGPRIAAVVLAAGRASRMGSNKLIAELDGEPIVRRTVRAVLASRARPVVVVTGHEADAVSRRADRARRQARSQSGLRRRHVDVAARRRGGGPARSTAALICLGDMPRLEPRHPRRGDRRVPIRRPGRDHRPDLRPASAGTRCCGRVSYFAEIAELSGDVGARALVDRHADQVRLLAIDDPAILVDVDTPAALGGAARRAAPADTFATHCSRFANTYGVTIR